MSITVHPYTLSGTNPQSSSLTYDQETGLLWGTGSTSGNFVVGMSAVAPYVETSRLTVDIAGGQEYSYFVGRYSGKLWTQTGSGNSRPLIMTDPLTGSVLDTFGSNGSGLSMSSTNIKTCNCIDEALDGEGNIYVLGNGVLGDALVFTVNEDRNQFTYLGHNNAALEIANASTGIAPDPDTGAPRWICMIGNAVYLTTVAGTTVSQTLLVNITDGAVELALFGVNIENGGSQELAASYDVINDRLILFGNSAMCALDWGVWNVAAWNRSFTGSMGSTAGWGREPQIRGAAKHIGFATQDTNTLRAYLVRLSDGALIASGSQLYSNSVSSSFPAQLWDEFQERVFIRLPETEMIAIQFSVAIYPTEPTEEDPFDPNDPDLGNLSPVLRQGPVIRTVNDNALAVQEALTKLADIDNVDGDVLQLTLDLNGHRLINLLDDGAPQSIKLRS